MNNERITLLQGMPIFGGLTRAALENLLGATGPVVFQPGEYIMRQGTPPGCVYVLEEGCADVVKYHGDHHYLLCALGRGDCIGEMSLIDPGPRSASVIAGEVCRAIPLGSADFNNLRRHDLAGFTLLQLNIAREVCRRLRAVEHLMLSALEGKADTSMIPKTMPKGA
ncbi:MAG: cyclic nucleotide-binding domain-containing protein [Acidobacteriota bacterium]|nr:cyclic nucleotide-binding domain-containing protein [Acidobacteriota bacterium]